MTESHSNAAKMPWAVDMNSVGAQWTNSISIADSDGGHIAHLTRGYEADKNGDGCPSFSNAALIVTAVNAYDRLLARDKLLGECVEALQLAEELLSGDDVYSPTEAEIKKQIKSLLNRVKELDAKTTEGEWDGLSLQQKR